MNYSIEITNLCKHYKNFSLDNITFSLPTGYVMGFIGANGSGKTTTIKLIMNLIIKNSGQINILGLDNVNNEQFIKENIGFVYDEHTYYENLKLKEIKNIVSPFYKNFNNEKFKEYITTFSLNENKKLCELSTGNKIKFSTCLALSHNPRLLIMDEPTSGLDPSFRIKFLDILRDIMMDENNSILFSTHITSDLDKIADYITLIDNGKLLLSDIKENIFDDYSIIKGDYFNLNTIQKSSLIGTINTNYGFTSLVSSTNKKHFNNKMGFLIERPNIEDIFIHITQKGEKIC